MATIICPNCRSSNIRRSRSRGVKEKLVKLVGDKAFRCKDCGWRGLIFSRGGRSSRVTAKQSYVFAIILGIILLALIIIFNIRDEEIEKMARAIFGNPQ